MTGSSRVKAIAFSRPLLSKGIEPKVMKSLMDALPKDTKIAGFTDDYVNNTTLILIANESFDEVPMGDAVPLVSCNFKSLEDGKVVCGLEF